MTKRERVMKSVRGNVKSIFLSLALVLLAVFALGFNAKAAGRVSVSLTTNDEVGAGKKVTFDVLLKNNTTDITYQPEQLALSVYTMDTNNAVLDNMTIISRDVTVSADKTKAMNKNEIAPGGELSAQLTVDSMPAAWTDKSSFVIQLADETSKAIVDMAIYTKLPYQDINQKDWFYSYAALMNKLGIMTGMDNGTFSPSEKLSRAQFATTLWRMNGSPEVAYDAAKFRDVPDKQFYTKAVMWASEKGIVTGYGEGNFGPTDSITREQLAEMMYRFQTALHLDAAATGDLAGFPDGDQITPFAVDGMKWSIGAGLISGNGTDSKLNPQGTADRAESSAILSRFYMHNAKADAKSLGTAQIMTQQ